MNPAKIFQLKASWDRFAAVQGTVRTADRLGGQGIVQIRQQQGDPLLLQKVRRDIPVAVKEKIRYHRPSLPFIE